MTRKTRNVFHYVAHIFRRAKSLMMSSISYVKHFGFSAFIVRAKDFIAVRLNQRRKAIQTKILTDNHVGMHGYLHGKSNKFEMVYDSQLGMASGRKTTEYVPISNIDFPIELAPLKLIAFYLPQFHPIPENDEWWGRGFTEWTNVSKAVPQFVGHYQPRLPGELGFYDLRVPDVQKRQIELARKYGIYGFAFYFYWFHGKRLLEKPLDAFFSDKENKFPFCIFWANENWTRRWDGKEDDVLIAQNHSPESDLAFIKDIEPYLRDSRYIRIDGKPVLLVYRVQLFPNPIETAKRWREYCREVGIGEIYLIAGQVYGFEDPRLAGFDAAVEFPPHNLVVERINQNMQILNPVYNGHIFRYEEFARFYSEKTTPDYELFKTVSPSWDNEARRSGKGTSITQSTPALYQQWLEKVSAETMKKEPGKRFAFINAWNEWAEGAYLEPDHRFGYAYLDATKNALQNSVKTPILLFQMSKVGSTSVANTLEKMKLKVPVYNTHALNNLDVMYANIKKRGPNAKDSLSVVKQGRWIREKFDSGEYETWNVISMVRDPIARNVSGFFQQLHEIAPDVFERIHTDSVSANELMEIFLARKSRNAAEWWFDNQLKPVFNFDIFTVPFDKEQGYTIYTQAKFRLLMMRLENINEIIQRVMVEFLGIENFSLTKHNVGKEKEYGKVYGEFLNLPLPVSYVDEMYSTRTARHFYTEAELERFTKHWTKK